MRAWRLDYQSFWLDEGFTASLTSGSLGYILHQSFTVEPNPPVYFLLLHLWRIAAGSSEYAIRYFSLAASVLSIPLLQHIGKRLGGNRAGLIAALLGTVNPFLVWLAQEARMYSLALLWVLFGVYFLLRALGWGHEAAKPGRSSFNRDLLLFGIANLLAVYTHLYAIFVLGSEGLFLLLYRGATSNRTSSAGATSLAGLAQPSTISDPVQEARKRRAKPIVLPLTQRGLLVGALGAAGLLFLPWLISIAAFSGETSTWRGFIGIWDMLRVLGANVVSQAHLPAFLDQWFAGLAGALALWGLIALLNAARSAWSRASGWILLSWAGFPVLAVYALSFEEPLFSPRYFIVAAPAFLLLLAYGLSTLPRPALTAGLAIFTAGSIWATVRGNTIPAYAKEDYRLAASYVGQRSNPNDAILLVANYIIYPFNYYFRGAGHVDPLNVEPSSNLDPLLAPIVTGNDRIWLVEAHDVFVDPKGRVDQWFRSRYPVADEKYITGIHFTEFDPHYALSGLPPGAKPKNIQFENGPHLAGYSLGPSNPGQVTLYWASGSSPSPAYHISLKLWTEEGPRQGQLGGQQDGEPLNGGLPFTRFPAARVIRDTHFVAAPPGLYDLRMSLYLPGKADDPILGSNETQVDLGVVRALSS